MNNKIYIIIIAVFLITLFFKSLPILIKLPNNKRINRVFELMPITILSVLTFPEIFTSIGNKTQDVFLVLIAMGVVTFLAYKKKSMGLTAFLSLATIIVLKEILNGNF